MYLMRKYQKLFKKLKPAMKGQEGQLCAQEGLEKFEKECERESGVEEAGQQGEAGNQHSL